MSHSEQEGKKASIRWLSRVLKVPRSSVYREPKGRDGRYRLNELLVQRIRKVIDKYPHYVLRMIHRWLNWGTVKRVNRKPVHRILKLMGWSMKKRPQGSQAPRNCLEKYHQEAEPALGDRYFASPGGMGFAISPLSSTVATASSSVGGSQDWE